MNTMHLLAQTFSLSSDKIGSYLFLGFGAALLFTWMVARRRGWLRKPEKNQTRPLPAVVVTIGSFLWPQLLVGLAIGIYAMTKYKGESWTPDFTPAQTLLLNALISCGILLSVWLFLRRRKQSVKSLGFKRPSAFVIVDILSAFAVYFVISQVLTRLFFGIFTGLNPEEVQVTGYEGADSGLMLVAVFMGLVIIPPIVEETVFRGFLYRGLKNGAPQWLAAVTTSFLFGLAHQQWNVAIDTFVLSMVMVYLVESTGTLWASVGLHALKNGLAFLVLFVLQ